MVWWAIVLGVTPILIGWALVQRRRERRQRSTRALAKLDAIEAELKRMNRWHPNPPDLQANIDADKPVPLGGAPTFELWLQCIFLPKARQAAATADWPRGSQVGLMASRHYDFPTKGQSGEKLCDLLSDFDGIVTRED